MNLSFWQKYGKAVVAFLFAVYTVSVPLWSGDHHIDANEVLIIISAFGANVVIYIVPLKPSFRWVKTAVTIVSAVVVALQSVIAGGVDANELAYVIGALVSVLLGSYAPAASPPKGTDPAVVVPSGIATG